MDFIIIFVIAVSFSWKALLCRRVRFGLCYREIRAKVWCRLKRKRAAHPAGSVPSPAARQPGSPGPGRYLLPISLCRRNWMLLALSASSGYCSTEST